MRTFGIFELNIPILNMGRSVFLGFLFVRDVAVIKQNVSVSLGCDERVFPASDKKNTAKADIQKLALRGGLKF